MDTPARTIAFLPLSVVLCILFCYLKINGQIHCEDRIHSSSNNPLSERLLLISFDGFRWNYLNGRAKTPHFDAMRQQGVTATKGLMNTYLTNTLPNHFSIVTGLYTESHGIVDNFMFDPVINQTFIPKFYNKRSYNHPDWHNTVGEPIWVSNQLQKRDGRSGVIMWMGGETVIKGVRPFRHLPYDDGVSDNDKIDILLDWLTDRNEPVNLGVVYFGQPDSHGHQYGPDSREVTQKIAELDGVVGYLLQRLKNSNMVDTTDIIITSDHGFVNVGKDRLIVLDNYIDPHWYKHASFIPGPVAGIIPNDGKENIIYENLRAASMETGHFTVYRKKDIPERFHYRNHRRVPEIFAIAQVGYTFVNNRTAAEEFSLAGNHGYDNELDDMHPFFIAAGPSFRENFAVETFPIVDIYPLMCHLLQIHPSPHNGTMSIVSQLLRKNPGGTSRESVDYWMATLITVGVLSSVILCIYLRSPKYKKN